MPVWYVDADRVPINWGAAVVGGRATQPIYEVRAGYYAGAFPTVVHTTVWAPTGGRVRAIDQAAAVAAEASGDPDPDLIGGGTVGSAPGAAGGGVMVIRGQRSNGDIAVAGTGGVWTELDPALRLTLPAAAGDWLETGFDAMRTSSPFYMDVATIVGGARVTYLSSETSVPKAEGSVSFYPPGNAYWTTGGQTLYQVQAGDIDAGAVTYGLFYLGVQAGTIYADSTYPFRWWVKNLRQTPLATG